MRFLLTICSLICCGAVSAADLYCASDNLEQVQAGEMATPPASKPSRPDNTAECLSFSAGELAQTRDAGAIMVDVRPPDHFAASHIEGAINITAHLIPSRRFLQSSPLILMGGDADLASLLTICSQLRAERQQPVFVEPQGIYAPWAKSLLVGSHDKANRLAELSANDYLRAQAALHWSVVVIADNAIFADGYAPAVAIPPSQVHKRLGELVTSLRANADRILLVMGDEADMHDVSGALRSSDMKDVRLLAGGLSAYRQLSASDRERQARVAGYAAASRSCPATGKAQ